MRAWGNGIRRAGVVVVTIFVGLSGVSSAWAALEEIVVTARKVEENLKDVPLSITAFSSDMIEAAGITNLADVAALTPGLSFFNVLGENLPVPIIRGVAQTDIFGETNAAIFVDGVYVSGREGLNFSQLDVSRIEVLKGPQSSQYGRTAFAGAINYVTKRPSDELEAKVELTGGNDGKQMVSALVSGPIFGDMLRGRVAALYDDFDGSYTNSDLAEGDNDIGGRKYRSFQGSLVSYPTDTLEIYASGYISNDEIDDDSVFAMSANCENRVDDNISDVRLNNFCGRVPDLDQVPSPGPGLVTRNSLPHVARALGEDRNIARGNLNISWTPDIGSFTSLTGFSRTKQKTLSDFGHLGNHVPILFCEGASIEGPAVPNSCGPFPADQQFFIGVLDEERGSRTEEISQELRFTSPRDQRFRYTLGGYGYRTTLDEREGAPISTRPLPVSSIPGTAIGLPPFDPSAPNFAIGTAIFYTTFTEDGGLDPLNRIESEQEVESWSVFGGADYDFNDRLTGRVELRFTHTREQEILFAYLKCTPTGVDPDCGDDIWDLRVAAPLPHDPDDPANTTNFGSERFSSITGRVGLDFRLNDDWMLYGSVSTGDKPGGIQLVPVEVITPLGEADEVLFNSFDTEELVAYELGLKGRTLDGRIGVDAAVFFLDWSDIVLRQLVEVSPNSGLPLDQPEGLNFNAGSADVWGWEISTDVGFTDNLTGRFTVNWTDAELTDAKQDTFKGFPTFAPDGDVSGNKLLRQAEWMGSASLDYRRSIRGDWDGFARIDVSYLDKIFIGNDNQSWLPPRTTANLRFGVESGSITVAFWVRNLFDDDDPIAAFRDIFFTNTDSITPPFADLGPRPSFDKFVPIRFTARYPSLRTYGITAIVRFGGAKR